MYDLICSKCQPKKAMVAALAPRASRLSGGKHDIHETSLDASDELAALVAAKLAPQMRSIPVKLFA